jgi:hypothetical protein
MLEPFSLSPDAIPAFELAEEIDVPLPELHEFLCDLHSYVPLHPFIESIQDLASTPSLPSARVYRVVDRIPLGPFRLKTVYTAALEPVSRSEVHGHAWQSPSIRLHTVYTLSKSDRGTRLVERCHVDARGLMRRFVVSQAKKAHATTLQDMKALLENGDPT